VRGGKKRGEKRKEKERKKVPPAEGKGGKKMQVKSGTKLRRPKASGSRGGGEKRKGGERRGGGSNRPKQEGKEKKGEATLLLFEREEKEERKGAPRPVSCNCPEGGGKKRLALFLRTFIFDEKKRREGGE